MRVLPTCGAGFIGTQVTVAFFGAIEVVVVDDLTRGQVGPLDSRTVFSELSVGDAGSLTALIKKTE